MFNADGKPFINTESDYSLKSGDEVNLDNDPDVQGFVDGEEVKPVWKETPKDPNDLNGMTMD